MIVLDTHAFYYLVFDDRKLGREARRVIERETARGGLVISDVTLIEIATLDSAGRLELTAPFGATLREAVEVTEVAVRPVDVEIAARVHGLAGALADHMDRVIVATALELGCPLVTSDGRITDSGTVKTIW